MLDGYILHLLILIGIYLILTLSLQLSLGYGGLLNFAHIAFFAIGAYVSALLTLNGFPFVVGILAGALVAGGFGALISLPTNKLKGDYLALGTIAFTFLIYALALNLTGLTNGALGLPGIPKPVIFNIHFSSNFLFFLLVLFFVLFTYFFIKRVVKSPFGKVIQATRDNEMTTRILGKNTFKVKTITLLISAFFAGIAGSLYAHYITYIDPSSFTLMQFIPVLCIVIVGGFASLKGTILATIILIILPEPLRFIGISSSSVAAIRQMMYAILLLAILLYRPKGLSGKLTLE